MHTQNPESRLQNAKSRIQIAKSRLENAKCILQSGFWILFAFCRISELQLRAAAAVTTSISLDHPGIRDSPRSETCIHTIDCILQIFCGATICSQNTKSKIRANNLLAEYKIQNPSQQSAGRMQMLKQFGRMSRQEQNSSLQNVESILHSPRLGAGVSASSVWCTGGRCKVQGCVGGGNGGGRGGVGRKNPDPCVAPGKYAAGSLSLIHISEPTRPY